MITGKLCGVVSGEGVVAAGLDMPLLDTSIAGICGN